MKLRLVRRTMVLLITAGVWITSACQPGGGLPQGPAGAATISQLTEQAAQAIASAVAEISTAGAQTATSGAATAIVTAAATSPTAGSTTLTAPPPGTTEPLPAPSQTAAAQTATPAVSPTFPPPGVAWIVFLQNRDLAVVNTTGAVSSLLTDTPYSEFLPSWSPDGTRIAYLRSPSLSSPGWQLMVMNADGSDLRAMDGGKQEYDWVWWLGDNNTLLAQKGSTAINAYFLVDANTGESRRIVDHVVERPVLSADHQRALFLITAEDTCNGKGCMFPSDVHLYDYEENSFSQITQDGEPKYSLAWSPDEQLIAYQTEDNIQMVIFDRSDQSMETASQPPWWVKPWALSPDGSQVASVQRRAVYLKGAAGSEDIKLFELPASQENPSDIDSIFWYPDGSGLVVGQWVALYAYLFSGSNLQQLPVYLENILFSVRPVASPYSPPPVPTPVAQWQPCSGAPPSRLRVGDKAEVSKDPPFPNNVRDIPDPNGELLGKIQPGEQVEILEGPFCVNNWVWWRVHSLQSGLEGWTAEGDAKDYWLVPLP